MTEIDATMTSQSGAGRSPSRSVAPIYWAVVAALALAGMLITDSYMQHVLILCFLWCMVAAAWDLTLGYAGIFNYAQIALFATGAYATAMLTLKLGMPPLVGIAGATAITTLLSLAIALPCLRLQGEYVALFTFSVHLAMPPLIQLAKGWGTGGTMGLLGVPSIKLFGVVLGPMNKIGWYYLALAAAAISVYVIYFIVLKSRTGRAFVALRDSPNFARSLGISEFKYRLLAFMLSAMITGFAGALYAHYTSVVTPKILGNEFILLAIVMLAIGGIGRFPGAVLGAFVVTILNELLRDAGTYRLLILGILVVLTLLWLPHGLASLQERILGSGGKRNTRAGAEKMRKVGK
jgi:branched-chain amino acid transport system permease protein